MFNLKKGGATLVGITMCSSVYAIDTGVKGFTLDGRVKAGASLLYDLDQGGSDVSGPANYLGEIKAAYRPDRNFTFIGNFWLRGMFNDPDFTEPTGGLKDLTAGPPFPSGSFQHGTSDCNLAAREYCAPNDELDSLDDFNEDVIREFSMKYRDSKRRYTAKIGKFQRGWGQSDGLRLLDILHAQDLREKFVFKDTDEVRLPSWMVSVDFNLAKMGLAAPFEAIGMHRPVLEVNVAEVRHSKFIINNPTTSGRTDGGVFGLQWPDFVDSGFAHQSGLGAVAFGATISEKEVDSDRTELSARLKFDTLGGTMTLNAFHGYQDLPVVRMQGATVHVGSGVNDPAGSVANVVVDHDTLIAALWTPADTGAFAGTSAVPDLAGVAGLGAGGYLEYLRAAAAAGAGTGAPIGSPLTALTYQGDLATACNDPVNNPGGAGVECSVSVDMQLDYTGRQKVVGMSFTRDMGDFLSMGPKGTSPSFRTEFSYEFDKPFNKGIVVNPFIPSQLEKGAVSNFVSPSGSVVERDVNSLMLGFDYPLWVPGWDSQQKSIFTSFQWFNIHTENADGLVQQAPYNNTFVESNQNYMTFLWIMPLDNQRLVFEGLYINNIDAKGTAYRQRIDFNYFGKNWRPRFEIQHFDGQAETAPVGLFNDKDFVEISLTYQF